MTKTLISVFLFLVLCSLAAVSVHGQTTEFTYQGSLHNGGTAATGNFDFEFLLYASLSGGSQIGSTASRTNVAVTNGIFSVKLDFGTVFPGADRYLEIRVRNSGGGGFTILDPRQRVGSSPHAIKSLSAETAVTASNATNASQLGGVAANQYVQTVDPRLTDARNPLGGSASYIQNQSAASQPASDFNITGTGKANSFDAASEFSINGIPALRSSQGSELVSVGPGAGNSSNGTFNTFAGSFTGAANRFGGANTFVGSRSGVNNRDGVNNTFVGYNSGVTHSGLQDVSNNTLIGAESKLDLSTITSSNATAIGYRSMAQLSNTLILGAVQGVNGGTGVNVGIGTTAPRSRLDVRGNIQVGNVTNTAALAGAVEAVFVNNDGGHAGNTFRMDAANNNLYIIGRSDAGATVGTSIIFRTASAAGGDIDRIVINPDGTLRLNNLGDPASTHLCFGALQTISFCSSSRRYKSAIVNYSGGLDLLQKFRPVEFTWKSGGKRDVGFIAEEVAEIEPLLTFKNPKGEIEGVQYSQITTVLVNSVKEQQQIIEDQQRQINELRKLLCQTNAEAEMCMSIK